MNPVDLTQADMLRVQDICARVKGYSGAAHYGFFKGLFTDNPKAFKILILGVYHGRDIAFMLDVMDRYHEGRDFQIVGVDKFTDAPCADWPEGVQTMTWGAAGFGEPPSFVAARENTKSSRVQLLMLDDAEFLAANTEKFDIIYLDTAHDYETVARQIKQAAKACNPGAIICGDDYSNAGTWGVQTAVAEAFTSHEVFANWIWISTLEKLRTK